MINAILALYLNVYYGPVESRGDISEEDLQMRVGSSVLPRKFTSRIKEYAEGSRNNLFLYDPPTSDTFGIEYVIRKSENGFTLQTREHNEYLFLAS